MRSGFVIISYKMALLFADQVYPDTNEALAVIGCDRFQLSLLSAAADGSARRLEEPAQELPGGMGFDGYWLLQ